MTPAEQAEQYAVDLVGPPGPLLPEEQAALYAQNLAQPDPVAAAQAEQYAVNLAANDALLPDPNAAAQAEQYATNLAAGDAPLPDSNAAAQAEQFATNLAGGPAPVLAQMQAAPVVAAPYPLPHWVADAYNQPAPVDAMPPEELTAQPEPTPAQVVVTPTPVATTDAPLSPLDLALKAEDAKIDSEAFARSEAVRLAKEDFQKQEANLAVKRAVDNKSRDALMKVDEDLDDLAQEGINSNRWRESRSTFQTIAMYVALAAGGLSQHITGRNIGLEMINDAINKDIEEQKANLENRSDALGKKKNTIAALMELGRSEYEATETMRIAGLQVAQKEADAQIALLDPRSSKAIRLGQTRNQILAAEKKAREDYDRRNRELVIKEEEHKAKMLEAAAKIAKLSRVGGGGARLSQEEWAAQGRLAPPGLSTEKERKAWVDAREEKLKLEGLENAKLKGAVTVSDEEKTQTIASPEGGALRGADGKPHISRATPEVVSKVKDTVVAASDVARNIDVILANGTEWDPGFFKTDNGALVKQSLNNIRLGLVKMKELGVVSGPDLPLVDGLALGGIDPTGLRGDALKVLRRARENITNDVDAKVRLTTAYDGPKIKFPDRGKEGREDSPRDKALEKALTSSLQESNKIVDDFAKSGDIAGISAIAETAKNPDAAAYAKKVAREMIDARESQEIRKNRGAGNQ